MLATSRVERARKNYKSYRLMECPHTPSGSPGGDKAPELAVECRHTPIGSPGADKSPEWAALGCIGPIGMSAIRWPIGSSTYRLSRSGQGSGAGCVGRFRVDRAVDHPLADR